jgi:hypothetical protein
MRRLTPPLIALALAGASVACDDAELIDNDPRCVIEAPATISAGLPGDTTRIPAAAQCAGLANPRIVWSTTTPEILAVDPTTGTLVARRAGTGIVSAAVPEAPGATRTIQVVVDPCPVGPSSIAVRNALTLVPGGAGVLPLTFNFARCTQPRDSTVTLTSADTSVVAIDARGLLVGRRTGATTVTVVSRANPAIRVSVPVAVGSAGPLVSALTVSPVAVTLGALDTVRVRATVTLGAGTPPGTSTAVTYHSDDRCAVQVDSTGLVTALGFGSGVTRTVSVAAVAAPTVSQQVRVTLRDPPPGPSIGLASLTTGAPPAPVDPTAVRGTITATAFVARAILSGPGRVELWLGGRLAAAAPLARFTPGEAFTRVPLTVNTAARDSAGVALYPNGARVLEIRVHSDGIAAVPGCPTLPAGLVGVTTQGVTLANP